ncbi:glycosyltransferase [Sphaerimonospora thailandensis]|uniref:Glycosyl transferase n=1 Tax=Sphaerimonospora thailandensis TaxID=795644 RepID=A0A8J3VYC5_9ACTN|nr:glycosyltransferase [Sphaerimonospora thailandensis]GIH68791.1 glycosyl transferase [Sphaerimonospora thailandensis]
MRIAMLIPPFRYGADPTQWITVPPQGYGGIQWMAATLIDGLLELGHDVLLLGAPGSPARRRLTVSEATTRAEVTDALDAWSPEIVHDHSNTELLPEIETRPTVSTHHLNGIPARRHNGVYLSRAQRQAADADKAPVIRIPVNPARCTYSEAKDDYLLFLGRVSVHKGPYQAAAFACAAGLPIKIAGPAWESDYLHQLLSDFPDTVEYLGEVGGTDRARLLARARALLALSQTHGGPFGGRWIEPGATVVSEAAASGTPVIGSDNGCLSEIIPGVGIVIPEGTPIDRAQARAALTALPSPAHVREQAQHRWGHRRIAACYVSVYQRTTQQSRS